jgi:5-(aminomethyl)-3-furanmethanol phosphate kinase
LVFPISRTHCRSASSPSPLQGRQQTAFIQTNQDMSPITIVKIGGSLTESDAAAQLMRTFAARRPRKLLIVPGGGEFADVVRAAQIRCALSDAAAHHMALLAMHTVGAMLADLAPGFVLAETVDEFSSIWRRELTPIWAPAQMVLAEAAIPSSWDVTSDSLAAWLASHIGAERLVLVKSCAIPTAIAGDAEALAAAGIVDAGFPGFAKSRAFSWEVASGAENAIEILAPG